MIIKQVVVFWSRGAESGIAWGVGVIILKPFGLTLPNKVCFGQNRKFSVTGSLQEFLGISHVIPTLENFQNYFYYNFIIKTWREWPWPFKHCFTPEQTEKCYKQAQIGEYPEKFKPFGLDPTPLLRVTEQPTHLSWLTVTFRVSS